MNYCWYYLKLICHTEMQGQVGRIALWDTIFANCMWNLIMFTGHTIFFVFWYLSVISICCFHLVKVESGGSLCEPCVWHSPVTPAAGYYWQDKWAGTRVWNSVLPCANQGLTGNHPSKTIWNDLIKMTTPSWKIQNKTKKLINIVT